MKDIESLPTRLSPQALIVLLWATVGLANAALSLIGPIGWAETIKLTGTTVCGLVLSLGISYATQNAIARRSGYAWPLLGMLVLVSGSSLWAIDATLQRQTVGESVFHIPTTKDFISVRFNLVYYNLLFCLQTAALALLSLYNLVRVREHQLSGAKLAAQQAQLAALRFQLNPHFLFNTLNAISTLVAEAGVHDAEEMISRLADFLRMALAAEPSDFTTLEKELEAIQAYLDIEFVRFGDRLNVEYSCPPGLRDVLVPCLLLQPLIENAIKYAVAPSKETVTVTITALTLESSLIIVIKNNGLSAFSRPAQSGTGLGLNNIKERLGVLYGVKASLKTSREGPNFVATIVMPLEATLVHKESDQ